MIIITVVIIIITVTDQYIICDVISVLGGPAVCGASAEHVSGARADCDNNYV